MNNIPIPNDSLSERGVLGSMILNGDIADEISEIIEPSDFFNPNNMSIFESILVMRNEEKNVDEITLFNHVANKDKKFNNDGMRDYISQLVNDCPNLNSGVEYAGIVKTNANKRNAIKILEEAVSEITNADDVDSVTSSVINRLEVTHNSTANEDKFFDFKTLFTSRAQLMQDKVNGVFVEEFIETGLRDLDSLLNGGLRYKHFDILAARPAMGKTSLACQFITHASLKNNIPCLLFSIEMSKEDIADKMISIISGVPYRNILSGDCEQDGWDKLSETMITLGSNYSKLIIDDETRDLNRIIHAIRMAKKRFGIRFVVIDYLQLITVPGKWNTKDEQLGHTVNSLAYVAKTLDLNILALSQINRGVESRTDKRPMLSDLRESGNIEQAAWRVLSIYRDEYYDPNGPDVGVAEIAVLKGKISNTGKVQVRFDKECTSFSNRSWPQDTGF